MPRAHRLSALALALVLAVAAAGCGDDSRTMRPPSADQTTTTAAGSAETTQVPGAQVGTDGFTVRVEGFLPGGALPVSLTCDGGGSAPVVSWQNVPAEAAELALTLTDQTDDGAVLWLVVGIEPGLAGVDGNDLPPGATTLSNSAGSTAWRAPCLPGGSEAHDFVFTLYALGATATEVSGDASTVISDLAGSSLGITTVAGTYPPAATTSTG